MQLEDKVILITGGAHRIGASIARLLHEHGALIIIHYSRSETEALRLAAELNERRAESVSTLKGDLTDVFSVRNRARDSIMQLGRLDGLVNNAAAFFPTPVSSTTEEQWQSIMDTNLKAPYFLSQAVAPYLSKAGGNIINITDIYADRPLAQHSVYSASKAGLVSLTRSLARELGPEIRVNAISPGAILWPANDNDDIAHQRLISRTPLKKMGDPDDIATTVLFLLTSASFISGQVINVDGGRSVVT